MQLGTSYKDIWRVSMPIIVGSAAQNLIALTDSVFLYYRSEEDFAAIGFVASFYLIIAAIGFGFSRGGQILIARRAGQQDAASVGRFFYSTLYFELLLAVLLFLVLRYGSYWIFASLIYDDDIFYKSLEYIQMRKYGVFPAFVGVSLIALYTGIARPAFVIVITLVLVMVNIIADRVLIFGGWGFPAMGIAGAGLASTIAEYVGTTLFLLYMLLDRKNRRYQISRLPKWDGQIVRQIVRVSVPIVVMSVLGLGSAFVFYGLIENLGPQVLAEANLVRIAYLILSIPVWGFSSGTNTIISYFIGRGRRKAVIPLLWKIAYMCLGITTILTLPLLVAPSTILYPLLGNERAHLIESAYSSFLVLGAILLVFSVSSIFFNGLIGAGSTTRALRIQWLATLGYTLGIYLVVHASWGSLATAWSVEIGYWLVIFYLTFRFLKRNY